METTHLWKLIQEWLDSQMFPVSQAALAEKVGVTRSAMSQWKSGQARPRPEHLRSLASVTRMPYSHLLNAVLRDLGYTGTEERDGDDHDTAPIELIDRSLPKTPIAAMWVRPDAFESEEHRTSFEALLRNHVHNDVGELLAIVEASASSDEIADWLMTNIFLQAEKIFQAARAVAADPPYYGLAARRGKKDNPNAGLGDEGIDAPGEWDGA